MIYLDEGRGPSIPSLAADCPGGAALVGTRPPSLHAYPSPA